MYQGAIEYGLTARASQTMLRLAKGSKKDREAILMLEYKRS